LLNLTSTTNRF